MADLSDKHKRFCEEYIKDNNGYQAAIRAGYSEKGAYVHSSRMLRDVKIRAYIDSLKENIAKENKIDAQWVLEKFQEIARISLERNEKGKIDAHGASRALENIAKHLGFYEKDNSQLNGPSTIKIEIIDPKDE